MPDRPNVILICVDQWRGDCFSIAGHPVVHTPYLDQLALRDVMPTLLDCAGLPVPGSVEGQSMLPMARSNAPVRWREYLHGEHTTLGQSAQWLTDGHEKYVWLSGAGAEQLFDLDEDPQELHDLCQRPEHVARVARWRERLVRELAGRPEGMSDGERLIPGRRVTPVLPAPAARGA